MHNEYINEDAERRGRKGRDCIQSTDDAMCISLCTALVRESREWIIKECYAELCARTEDGELHNLIHDFRVECLRRSLCAATACSKQASKVNGAMRGSYVLHAVLSLKIMAKFS